MRLREPALVAIIVFAAALGALLLGDPWSTAIVLSVGAGLVVLVYGGKGD